MPPRKQPRRMEDMALEVLAACVGQCVVDTLRKKNSVELRRNVAILKENACSFVPPPLFTEFAFRILKKMYKRIDREEFSQICSTDESSALIDLIEDLGTTEFYPRIRKDLLVFVYKNLSKFKKLRNLDYVEWRLLDLCNDNETRETMKKHYLAQVRNCNSKHLRRLVCPAARLLDLDDIFTPEHLPALENVIVFPLDEENGIGTVDILRILCRFSELREVDLLECNATDDLDALCDHFDDLLRSNKNLTQLATACQPRVLLRSNEPFPSLRLLRMEYNDLTTTELRALAEKFPNLTSFTFESSQNIDLSALTEFRKLSSVDISEANFTTASLDAFLEALGSRLVCLNLPDRRSISTEELNRVHRTCKNLEVFRVSWNKGDGRSGLLFPPFENLKRLTIRTKHDRNERFFGRYSPPELTFSQMLSLEYLHADNFKFPDTWLDSIVGESTNFPRLTEMRLASFGSDNADVYNRKAEAKNLDFMLLNIHILYNQRFNRPEEMICSQQLSDW